MSEAYPSSVTCSCDLPLPQSAELTLRAWRLVLDAGTSPYTFAPDIGENFILVAPKAMVSVDPAPAVDCPDGELHYWFGQLAPSTTVTWIGERPATIYVFGVAPDDVPDFGAPLQRAGGISAPFPPFSGDSAKVIMRQLDLNCPGTPISAESWARPSFLLTSGTGPQARLYLQNPFPLAPESSSGDCDPQQPGEIDANLDIVAIPPSQWLSFLEGSATTMALLCDFYDTADTADAARTEGCTWRCPGSWLS